MLDVDGVMSKAQSLEFHSLDVGSQGQGIHPFAKSLGIMFRAFVHTNHMKALVYLTCHF